MAEHEPPQEPGWYWVQDMRGAARPAFFDGVVYRDSPTALNPLSWHWPSFRRLGRVREPAETEIKEARNGKHT